MSAETIKYTMRSLLNPLAQLLVAMEISPGAITVAGLVLSAVAGLTLGLGAFLAGAIVLILSGLCDMLDGMVARSSGKAGEFGAVADSVTDRYADAVVLFGLFYYYAFGKGVPGGEAAGADPRPAFAAYLALAAIVGSFMVSYVRARAEGVGLECKIGILERPWRIVLLIIGALLGPGVMVVILWILAILTHATAMQRVLEVKKQVAKRRARQAGTEANAAADAGALAAASLGAETRNRESRGGLFVTLEGVEGSGKSTQAALVADILKAKGRNVVVTREPGGTAAGESIREILLGSEDASIGPEAELLLYMASRAQHVRDVISPALDSGAVVLCDRFSDATVAYQAGGRGLPAESITALDAWATGGLKPDLTVLLDLPEAEGLARAGGRGDEPDRMEREGESFHRDVRKAYLDIAKREPGRVKIVDATASPEIVGETIVSLIETALTGNPGGANG